MKESRQIVIALLFLIACIIVAGNIISASTCTAHGYDDLIRWQGNRYCITKDKGHVIARRVHQVRKEGIHLLDQHFYRRCVEAGYSDLVYWNRTYYCIGYLARSVQIVELESLSPWAPR